MKAFSSATTTSIGYKRWVIPEGYIPNQRLFRIPARQCDGYRAGSATFSKGCSAGPLKTSPWGENREP